MRKLLFFLSLMCFGLQIQAREQQNFDRGWLFCLGDNAGMSASKYVDSGWRRLNLPHDWSIEADFSEKNPSGVGGGALPGGIGWYRKHFTVDKNEPYSRFFIDFDGVYMNSDVYLNGHHVGINEITITIYWIRHYLLNVA